MDTVVLRDADEIEQFFIATTGMKPGYLQLSGGAGGLRLQCVELAGVTLIWAWAQGRVRWQDEMTGDSLHIGFALSSSGPIKSLGRDVGTDQAQVWMPGKVMDLIMTGPYLTLDIGVQGHLVEELGWRCAGEPLLTVPEEHLGRLFETCRLATALGDSLPRWQIEGWRDQVLERLEPVLHPWLVDPHEGAAVLSGTRHYRLLRRADDFLDSLEHGAPLEVDRLAQSLDVPRRTVFHAYRKLLGLGPRRYFELKRLQVFRTRLKQASRADTTVTSIATELGFGDVGRLAALYRGQFGENPSATLNREQCQGF